MWTPTQGLKNLQKQLKRVREPGMVVLQERPQLLGWIDPTAIYTIFLVIE